MSAILLNNPFAAPPPATQQTAVASPALPAIASTGGASSAKDSAGFANTGSGAETSKQAEIAKIFQTQQKLERPANATGDSVINAQSKTDEPVELGPDLPEVEMPDPLPTSPFLLQLKDAG